MERQPGKDPTVPRNLPPSPPGEVTLPPPNQMTGFRRFSRAADDLSRDWYRIPEAPLPWVADASLPAAPGVEGGFWVTAGPIRGWAKPRSLVAASIRHPPVACIEKVASDLAYYLGLPVPPVTLFERLQPPAGEPRYQSVSAPPFEQVFTWGDVRAISAISADLLRDATAVMSAMLVFDTWLQCSDHRDHPANLLVTSSLQTDVGAFYSLAYIDYAWSMVKYWRNQSAQNEFVAPVYDSRVTASLDVLSEVVTQIEGVPDNVIEHLVERVPSKFVTDEDRKIMIDGLRVRRNCLRRLIASAYPGINQ